MNKKTKIYIIINIVLFLIVALLAIMLFQEKRYSIIKALNAKQRIIVPIESVKVIPEKIEDGSQESNNRTNNQQASNQLDNKNNSIVNQEKQIINIKKKYITILVTELGLSKMSTETALHLPKEVNMGFSPYSYGLGEWLSKTAAKGHDIFIELPLEPQDYPIDNPGPLALLTNLPDKDNLGKLQNLVNLYPNLKGFYTIETERFTNEQNNIDLIANYLVTHNLLWVHRNNSNEFLKQFNNKYSCNLMHFADIILDDEIDEEKIKDKLYQAKQLAEKQNILVVARPYPISIRLLDLWIASLKENDVQLITLSELFKLKD